VGRPTSEKVFCSLRPKKELGRECLLNYKKRDGGEDLDTVFAVGRLATELERGSWGEKKIFFSFHAAEFRPLEREEGDAARKGEKKPFPAPPRYFLKKYKPLEKGRKRKGNLSEKEEPFSASAYRGKDIVHGADDREKGRKKRDFLYGGVGTSEAVFLARADQGGGRRRGASVRMKKGGGGVGSYLLYASIRYK